MNCECARTQRRHFSAPANSSFEARLTSRRRSWGWQQETILVELAFPRLSLLVQDAQLLEVAQASAHPMLGHAGVVGDLGLRHPPAAFHRVVDGPDALLAGLE